MKKVSLLVLLACSFLGALEADIITVQVRAEITQFEDYGGYFDGSIFVGSFLTMTYSYDTETPNSNPYSPPHPNGKNGIYYQLAPNFVQVEIGNYILQSNQESLDYVIGISSQATNDVYYIRSSSNIILPNEEIINSHIYWDIHYDAETFDNTNLPTVAPDISPLNYIQIGDGREFTIYATPTSVEIIPEPITLIFMGFGALLIRAKRS